LVLTISFAKLDDQIFLLKVRAENHPEDPKHIEEQSVRIYVRARPDECEHEKIKRMANPEIGSADDEV
jgi:hypothetical protein